MPSLRKADAKVVLLYIHTKLLQHFFLEYFVNKYNSLETKEVEPNGSTSLLIYYAYARAVSFLHLRDNEFITFAMDVDNLHSIIILEMLTQLSDIHIHATGIEIIIIYPNSLQSKISL